MEEKTAIKGLLSCPKCELLSSSSRPSTRWKLYDPIISIPRTPCTFTQPKKYSGLFLVKTSAVGGNLWIRLAQYERPWMTSSRPFSSRLVRTTATLPSYFSRKVHSVDHICCKNFFLSYICSQCLRWYYRQKQASVGLRSWVRENLATCIKVSSVPTSELILNNVEIGW